MFGEKYDTVKDLQVGRYSGKLKLMTLCIRKISIIIPITPHWKVLYGAEICTILLRLRYSFRWYHCFAEIKFQFLAGVLTEIEIIFVVLSMQNWNVPI